MDGTDWDSRHSIYVHPSVTGFIVTLAGDDDDDAKPYQERLLQDMIARARQASGTSGQNWSAMESGDETEFDSEVIDAYAMTIEWSDEDDAFLVIVPDLPGLHTHGATREEAESMGREAIELWLYWARQHGFLPPPTS